MSDLTGGPQDRTYWNDTAQVPSFPRLLKDRGMRVAVIEARRVGRQVTGKSTAKMSSQHGILYQTLEQKFGEDKARLYADAQETGIRKISELAAQYGIEADIEPMPAYVWTEDESYVSQLEKEVEVAQRLGLPASLERGDIGLPFPVLAAMRWANQAQFHPVKYVAGLAATIPGDGSYVFEGTRALDYEPTKVVTETGTVTARHVVMATHLPLGQIGLYYTMAFPHAEPVIAAPIGRVPPGMYKNAEKPGRSIRTHRSGGRTWAIAAGTTFKPGHPDDEQESIKDVERWLAEHFEAGPVEYRWVNEDYDPMDSAPYIGWSSATGPGYLVATGFAAWGISNGTAAAMIIADLAEGKENAWLPVFDATRVKPIAGGKEFAKENLAVAAHLVGGYLSRKPKSYDELEPGHAAIMKVDGANVAAFKDESGRVHAVSAVCTHNGCIVGWNATDRTWDCPCHGSRFELSGEVIHGPATRPLGCKITG
jgi:glycine/D-amino acid oxidase-like deaminating enzyme/nitrite reductase/ring-hydroxylating ferredoxin subunit